MPKRLIAIEKPGNAGYSVHCPVRTYSKHGIRGAMESNLRNMISGLSGGARTCSPPEEFVAMVQDTS